MFKFSAQERRRIFEAIQDSFGSSADFVNRYIDSIEQTGKILIFGYGSLMKVPHNNQKTIKYPARIEGKAVNFNNAWRFYSGSHAYPSLMMGLEEREGSVTPGEITELNFMKADGTADIDAIVQYFKDFRIRENPPGQDIYAYNQNAFLDVIPEGQAKPVTALGCVTDTQGPLYIGTDGENLSLDEKAIIIANEFGSQLNQRYSDGSIIYDGDEETLENDGVSARKPHQKTIYSYVLEFADARYKRGMPVEPELEALIQKINYYRAQMDPSKRLLLEAMESGIHDQTSEKAIAEYYERTRKTSWEDLPHLFRSAQQERRNLDQRVFRIGDGPDLSQADYEQKLFSARNKLRATIGMPPLPKDHVKAMLSEDDILHGVLDPRDTFPALHNN